MKRILYIAKRGKYNIGARLHLNALRDIFGEKNVYIVDLLNAEKHEEELYISFGQYRNVFERINRYFQGNINMIDNHAILKIGDIVQENQIKFVFSEESDLGNLMKYLKSINPNLYIVCFFHDISADLFSQRRKHAPIWKFHYKLECGMVIKQEEELVKYTSENWVFNNADYEKFKKYYGINPQCIIPLCTTLPVIENAYYEIYQDSNKQKNILFVCSDYYVNVDGFMWFLDNVYNYLVGNYHIDIVGTGSRLIKITSEQQTHISIIGPVDRLDKLYLNADIVITPIFAGGGMKVKTLEAVSYGKVIVGSGESLHGFWENLTDDIKDNVVYRCETAEEWISSLNKLINSRIYKVNRNLRDVAEKSFSYTAMLKKFRDHLSFMEDK